MRNAKYHTSCILRLEQNDVIVVSVPYMGGYNGERLIRVLAGKFFNIHTNHDYCYGFRVKQLK